MRSGPVGRQHRDGASMETGLPNAASTYSRGSTGTSQSRSRRFSRSMKSR
jgi:hypothetical protein